MTEHDVDVGVDGPATRLLRRRAVEWLAFAGPSSPIDIERFVGEQPVAVEQTRAGFTSTLADHQPLLVILIAPPADSADVVRLVGPLESRPGMRAVLLCDHDAVALRLTALNLGFRDAIDLSADPEEIAGRIAAAGRMVAQPVRSASILVADETELDLRAHAIWRRGTAVRLRPREYELLKFLATHPGQAFTRQDLLDHVWSSSARRQSQRTVDVHVFTLRSKIEHDPSNPVHLVTVRGAGYRLDPPAASPDAPRSVSAP